MTNPFLWPETLLYCLPIFVWYGIDFIVDTFQVAADKWYLKKQFIFIPIWGIVIHVFGLLIFNFSLIPIMVLLIVFGIVLDLYDYVRTINVFDINLYMPRVFKIVPTIQLFFAIGVMILRIFTYF